MKNWCVLLVIIALTQSCKPTVENNLVTNEEETKSAVTDSLEMVKEQQLKKEKSIKDSIAKIEQQIAIGEILFNISEREFGQKRKEFLKKCKLPERQFYKRLTFFRYKLGEYGFLDLTGRFYKDSLYSIRFNGPIVEYDEYDLVMPDQLSALSGLLKAKYGEPTIYNGLPRWNDLDKGYYRTCAMWRIGDKQIEIRISCEGVIYDLNLNVFKPHIVERIQKEKDDEATKSTKKAIDML